MENSDLAYAKLEKAILSKAQLEGAILSGAQLSEANLTNAILNKAKLVGAQLEKADLRRAQLEEANLNQAKLKGSDLSKAQLNMANLRDADLNNSFLLEAQLNGAELIDAQLNGASLIQAQLNGAELVGAQLHGANLMGAQLREARLMEAQLNGANLIGANLNGANLAGAQLENVMFMRAQLGGANLAEIKIANSVSKVGPILTDVQWENVNLTIVDWSQVKLLDDEYQARQKKNLDGKLKDRGQRLYDFKSAVRANRQLAVALKNQGIDEDAARFAYRAQVLQERVLWYQTIQPSTDEEKVTLRQRTSSFFAWLYSCLLFLLSGYGYRIHRSFLTYIAVIGFFTVLYHLLVPGLAWQVALEVSLNACLSRGIPPSAFQAGDVASLVSDVEAFIGLVIEVVFIATLTQRFFNK